VLASHHQTLSNVRLDIDRKTRQATHNQRLHKSRLERSDCARETVVGVESSESLGGLVSDNTGALEFTLFCYGLNDSSIMNRSLSQFLRQSSDLSSQHSMQQSH
jgi:hypothetical protein